MKRIYCVLVLSVSIAWAGPKGGSVKHGKARISKAQSHLTEIHTETHRSVIHWDEFSLNHDEMARFIQPDNNGAVLNRVVGGKLSALNGLIESNGRVYLINPSGIIMGKDAVINTAGFIASTLNVIDEEFLGGGALTFRGSSAAPLINYGTIKSKGGDVALLGRLVKNEGLLEGDEVLLGVGQHIVLQPAGYQRLFIVPQETEDKTDAGLENSGQIQAIKAELRADGNAYKMAINHSGCIEAVSTEMRDGRVFLVAEGGVNQVSGRIAAKEVYVMGEKIGLVDQAKIDVSRPEGGGKVLIGGDFQGKSAHTPCSTLSVVEEGVVIDARATICGDGGKIIVWSDGGTGFSGSAFADAGFEGGNGGLIEISGKEHLNFNGTVTTFAPKGKAGLLLLDPTDVTISSSANANATFSGGTYTYSAGAANIKGSDIASKLATSNVLVSTTSSFLGTGNITVETGGNVTWNGANSLALVADHDITLLDFLACSNLGGNGGLSLNAAHSILMSDTATSFGLIDIFSGPLSITCGGDLIMQAPAGFGAQIAASIGSNTFNIGGNLQLSGGGVGIAGTVNIGGDGTSRPGPVNLHFVNVGKDLILQGGSTQTSFAQIGLVAFNSGTFTGDITFDHIGGNVLLQGGSGGFISECYAQIGHSGRPGIDLIGEGNINLALVEGNISLLGGSADLATAVIGHGNSFTDGTVKLSGSISINQLRQPKFPGSGVLLKTGTGADASAIIGFGNSGFQINPFIAHGSKVSLTANSPIQLDATIGSNAVIGYDNDSVFNDNSNVLIDLISVTTTKSITLIPGNTGFIQEGRATIGTSVDPGAFGTNSAKSNILIHAGGDLTLAPSPLFLGDGLARIINNRVDQIDPLDITIHAKNIFVGRGLTGFDALLVGQDEIFSSGTLTAIADVNMELDFPSLIHNGSGSVTLVVDNAFPSSPEVGPGAFVLESGAQLFANGPLRIFTSRRVQNVINAPINGVTFIPGSLFVDSATEQWGTYFPNSFGGFPFTIFYKELLPAFLNQAKQMSEGLQDLRTYDTFLFWPRCYFIGWGLGEQMCEMDYQLLRPLYRNYQTKYIYAF